MANKPRLNGWYVCTENLYMSGEEDGKRRFTKGKVYYFQDGKTINDTNTSHYIYEHSAGDWYNYFVENKIKVGDIVFRHSTEFDDEHHFYGHVFQVGSIPRDGAVAESGLRKDVVHSQESVRIATDEEIENFIAHLEDYPLDTQLTDHDEL